MLVLPVETLRAAARRQTAVQSTFFLALTILLVACSNPTPVPIDFSTQPRPGDFRVTYHWEEGSLPPPYHYEYTISIGPDQQGSIELIPDYSFNDPPVWRETFSIALAELDALYALLVEMGVFTREWLPATDYPTGGSIRRLTADAHGQRFSVPSFVADETAARDIRAVYDAVRAMVPETVWDKLKALRERYVAEHPDQ